MALNRKKIEYWLKKSFALSADVGSSELVEFSTLDDGTIQARVPFLFATLELNDGEAAMVLGAKSYINPAFGENVILIAPTGIGSNEEESLKKLYADISKLAPAGFPSVSMPIHFKDGQTPSFLRHEGLYRLVRDQHPMHDHANSDLYDLIRFQLDKDTFGKMRQVERLPFATEHFHLMAI